MFFPSHLLFASRSPSPSPSAPSLPSSTPPLPPSTPTGNKEAFTPLHLTPLQGNIEAFLADHKKRKRPQPLRMPGGVSDLLDDDATGDPPAGEAGTQSAPRRVTLQ